MRVDISNVKVKSEPSYLLTLGEIKEDIIGLSM
jgi:hypothetical protein